MHGNTPITQHKTAQQNGAHTCTRVYEGEGTMADTDALPHTHTLLTTTEDACSLGTTSRRARSRRDTGWLTLASG